MSASKRALVTGAGGFVGSALRAYLHDLGWETLGCDAVVREGDGLFRCDITDMEQATALFAWAGPCDYVFHLAAAASVSAGLRAPGRCMRVNVEGTVNICEAMLAAMPQARLIFISSAEVYGAPETLPVDETHPLRPVNPYAISKLAAEQYCRYMGKSRGMNVVMLRPFNHAGPGQTDQFVLSSFARQLVEMEKGLRRPALCVGNLSAKRDFMHVADVVRAYALAAELGERNAVYNLSSGESHSLREAVELMRGMTTAAFEIEQDPDRQRPVDVPELLGSSETFRALTSWRAELPLARILKDALDYWRSVL